MTASRWVMIDCTPSLLLTSALRMKRANSSDQLFWSLL